MEAPVDAGRPGFFTAAVSDTALMVLSPVDVAYVSYPEGEIWRSRIDGSEKLQLTFSSYGGAFSPRWSPDGKKIVFVRESQTHRTGFGYTVLVLRVLARELSQLRDPEAPKKYQLRLSKPSLAMVTPT